MYAFIINHTKEESKIMANVSFLITMGFTNVNTEDIGVIATAKPYKVFALCCGEYYKENYKGACIHCSHYLYWEREPFPVADDKIERYLSRGNSGNNFLTATAAV